MEVKVFLYSKIGKSMEKKERLHAEKMSADEIIRSLRGAVQLTQEEIDSDERLQYILSK